MNKLFSFLKPKNEFGHLALPFWKTPDFLISILMFINVGAMLGTYFWASRRVDPQEAFLWVALESVVTLVIGNAVIELFKKSLSALKMKKDFISIISHQLRTPLTTIRWSLERIEKEPVNFSEKQKRYLEKIFFANDSLIESTKNFIFLEKIEDDRDVKFQSVEVVSLMTKKIKEAFLLARTKKIKIKTFFNQKELFVSADETFLGIIIDNFLSNALRYSFEKSVVSVRIKKSEGRVVFLFENTGVKIEENEMQFLFEKFYRSVSAREFSPQGSGLGLYISKVLAEKMGGKVGVSLQGRKTIFQASFPGAIKK